MDLHQETALRQMMPYLQENLKVDPPFLKLLKNKSVLDKHQIEKLQHLQDVNQGSLVQTLGWMLLQSEDTRVADSARDVLFETGQEDIAKRLYWEYVEIEECATKVPETPEIVDDSKMETVHQKVIGRRREYLVDHLRVTPLFLAHLFSVYVISMDDLEDLLVPRRWWRPVRESTGMFCSRIVQKGGSAFVELIRALEVSDQAEIAEELLRELQASVNSSTEPKPLLAHSEHLHPCDQKQLMVILQDLDQHPGLQFSQLAVDQGWHTRLMSMCLNDWSGMSLEVTDSAGQTLLHRAARAGQIFVLECLLGTSMNGNTADKRGRTCLHTSIISGQSATTIYLIHDGRVDSHALDHNRQSALYMCCLYGDAISASLLLSKGAALTTRDRRYGCNALFAACESGHVALVDMLLNSGADMEELNRGGRNPLHAACESGHVDVAELLLNSGANIEARDNTGDTPLIHASWRGHSSVTKLLLRRGANVNVHGYIGFTALHWACESGHASVVPLLLSAGADTQSRDKDGFTAHICANKRGGNYGIIRTLLRDNSPTTNTEHTGYTN